MADGQNLLFDVKSFLHLQSNTDFLSSTKFYLAQSLIAGRLDIGVLGFGLLCS